MKKLDQKGVVSHLLLVLVLLGLAVGGIGYYVFQQRSINAKAQSWHVVKSSSAFWTVKPYSGTGSSTVLGSISAVNGSTYRLCVSGKTLSGSNVKLNMSLGSLGGSTSGYLSTGSYTWYCSSSKVLYGNNSLYVSGVNGSATVNSYQVQRLY